jgi:hypothetical protein
MVAFDFINFYYFIAPELLPQPIPHLSPLDTLLHLLMVQLKMVHLPL